LLDQLACVLVSSHFTLDQSQTLAGHRPLVVVEPGRVASRGVADLVERLRGQPEQLLGGLVVALAR